MKLARDKQEIDKIIYFDFKLDMGDIRLPIDSEYRKELLRDIYFVMRDSNGRQDVEAALEEVNRLKTLLNTEDDIRIWYSDIASETCGLYYLCDLLNEYKNEIYLIKLPEMIARDKCIVSYKNWSEVEPKDFKQFENEARKISDKEKWFYSIKWNELKQDNSQLRAIINGKVIGVPEDFYDFQIFKYLNDEPIEQGLLIGTIIGQSQLGVEDWWYARRIEEGIDSGKIKIVADNEMAYKRLLSI